MQTLLGKRVKELRKSAGFTLKDLGEKVGRIHSYIWHIENNGRSAPTAEMIQKISDELGTTVEYLLHGKDVSETSASDAAFIRKYKKMDEEGKKKVRKMCDIL